MRKIFQPKNFKDLLLVCFALSGATPAQEAQAQKELDLMFDGPLHQLPPMPEDLLQGIWTVLKYEAAKKERRMAGKVTDDFTNMLLSVCLPKPPAFVGLN